MTGVQTCALPILSAPLDRECAAGGGGGSRVEDVSGFTHGIGWCAPQQGACKLTLNVKEGIIQEALVETIGCSGMTHSAAMASEILPGLTLLEALNTDLVCDAINTAMRELFLQIVYGRARDEDTIGFDCSLRGRDGEDLLLEFWKNAIDRKSTRLNSSH